MAEKSDEEIIKEVGLETSENISDQEALDSLSFDDNEIKGKIDIDSSIDKGSSINIDIPI